MPWVPKNDSEVKLEYYIKMSNMNPHNFEKFGLVSSIREAVKERCRGDYMGGGSNVVSAMTISYTFNLTQILMKPNKNMS